MQLFPIWRSLGIVSFAVALTTSFEAAPNGQVHADDEVRVEWVARVDGTDRLGAQLRSGPGTEYPASFALPDGSVVRVIDETSIDEDGRGWCPVALGGPGTAGGWIARDFLVPVASRSQGEVPLMAASLRSGEQPMQRFQATVTAYTYQAPGWGAHGSITRSGTTVHWGTVAVDPKVIPLGSSMRIDGFGDIFVAEDTGGAIHGSRVEIFFPDEEAALRFGVQQREVTVFRSPDLALAP